MSNPSQILERTLARGSANLAKPLVKDQGILDRVEYVCRCLRNRAGARLLMSCLLEIAILDCTGFLRHFLHLFHRSRIDYLDAYQALVLAEPDSAVSQPLKEAFLALRQAAEADE